MNPVELVAVEKKTSSQTPLVGVAKTYELSALKK
jgi:hypothetical protein